MGCRGRGASCIWEGPKRIWAASAIWTLASVANISVWDEKHFSEKVCTKSLQLFFSACAQRVMTLCLKLYLFNIFHAQSYHDSTLAMYSTATVLGHVQQQQNSLAFNKKRTWMEFFNLGKRRSLRQDGPGHTSKQSHSRQCAVCEQNRH